MSDRPTGPFLFDPLPEDDEPAEPAEVRTELPLDESAAEPAAASTAAPQPTAHVDLARPQQVLFEEPAEDPVETADGDLRRRHHPDRVSPLARLTSGLLDLAVALAVALVALVGSRLLGVEPRMALLPGVLLFVVTFSFVYHVFTLLFWGRTPGMASADLVTRDPSGQSLTAWQSTLRWAGSLGTVLLAGLPMIVSWFTGWSLADLVSGSETKVEAG